MRTSANRLKERQQQWSLQLLRLWFRSAGRLSHHSAAALAYRLFSTPIRYKPSDKEVATLAGSEPFDFAFRDRHLRAWRWGHGPVVLLVHGWAGRGSQLTPFVPPLLDAGLSVIAYDAPAHGLSPGRRSSLIGFADAVQAFAEAFGPLYGVIAHSLGGAATMYAMTRGAEIERVALIAPPARPREYVEHFGEVLGIAPEALALMKRRVEERFGVQWRDLDMPDVAAKLDAPLLLVHDIDDDDAPVEGGREIAAAWKSSELIVTEQLGHRRILRDPYVVQRVTEWLTRETRA